MTGTPSLRTRYQLVLGPRSAVKYAKGAIARRIALAEARSLAARGASGAAGGIDEAVDAAFATQGADRAKAFAQGQLDKHLAKHAAEWGAGNIAKTGYRKRAQSLLGKDVGGDILGAVPKKGDVLRYNSRTNEFAVGTADGTIRTLFRPKNGMDYWKRVTNGL